MAIDPTIALGLRPVESPLESYGKALQIQNMQTQGKMGQLGVQQLQTNIGQQQALNAAYADPANRNPDGSINYQGVSASLAKANAGSQIPGVMKAGLETQKALTDQQLNQMKLIQMKNDRVADHIQGLMSKKDVSYDDVKTTMDQALQSGDIDQHAYQRGLAQFQPGMSAPAIKATLAQQAASVYATGAKLQQFIPQTKAETVGGQIVPVTTTQATGEVTTGKPLVSTPVSEAGKTWQDTHPGQPMSPEFAAAADRKATYIAPSAITMMMGQSGGGAGFDATKPLPPAQEAQARMIADGGAPMTPSSRNPLALPINARAQQIYADANGGDMTGFGTAHGTLTQGRKSFAAGGANSKTLVALDTAIHHFDALGKAVDALNNGDTVALNAVGNYMSKQFGDPAVTNFDTVKTLAADEFTKVAAGVTSGEGEREKMQSLFQAANSPQQLRQAIHQAQVLMAGKVQGLDTAYKGVYGPNRSVMEQVSPETKSVIGNASRSIPTPSLNEPTAVGPNGHKIVYRNGNWMDPQTGKVVE